MLTVNLSAVLAFLSILGIAASAIIFMVKLWNKNQTALIKVTIALDGIVEEVRELKQYGTRIQKLEDTKVDREEFNKLDLRVNTIETQHKRNHKE